MAFNLNNSRLTPCGQTRKEFIWEAGGGFMATALTFLLGQEGPEQQKRLPECRFLSLS